MYQLKNYLLSMRSHWMINQSLYEAVQESMPDIAKFRASQGQLDLKRTAVQDHVQKIFPDVYRVPLFRRSFCKMLVEEIGHMRQEIPFEPNPGEDELRQIPEIVLAEHVPELQRSMWFVVKNVLNPIFWALYQRNCADIGSIQIANYNLQDKKQGAWHHDSSADISVVVPLNTGEYEGGGTEFHQWGTLNPLPTGHALIFPSFTNLHRGLPVVSGDRFLLVFWLYDRARVVDNAELWFE